MKNIIYTTNDGYEVIIRTEDGRPPTWWDWFICLVFNQGQYWMTAVNYPRSGFCATYFNTQWGAKRWTKAVIERHQREQSKVH
jgi:hypothetical protein